MREKIKALIADDEPLAREKIVSLLEGDPEIEIIGECADGSETVMAIEKEPPDLLFLDIQMPELDGFGVLEMIDAKKMPVIIFVTAYDQYALRAFEVHALDYLLKPFDRERFQKALQRAKARIQYERGSDIDRRLQALVEYLKVDQKFIERLVIKTAGRVYFLKVEEIDWIEAAGNYVRLHVAEKAHLMRETMNELEGRLDPSKFLRIHRSTIVNIRCIKELQPHFRGDYLITLHNGTQLTLSRNYRDRLREIFGESL